jgi:excisionase family DNA binding protein
MSNTEKVLLTVPQAAERLNVTQACIRRWILERKITTIKLGRLTRIPSAEIDRLTTAGLRPARPAR